MRHVFILNPTAGKKSAVPELRQQIETYFSAHPTLEYAILETDGVGAATRLAAQECAKGDAVRLYACGGDGTLQETANGIPVGSATAELTVVPCGSGNDFVRIFGGKEAFSDIAELIEGETVLLDAVDCGDTLSLNIASMGMDAAVGQKMQRYKHLPGVSGSMAYNLAVADVFCHPLGSQMEIEIDTEDGTVRRNGKYLMALAANGRYYGGGYCGAPYAVEDDGLLDFVLVTKISRLKIPAFIGRYKAGRHEGLGCCEHIRGKAMRVKAAKPVVCNIDGECFSHDTMAFSVVKEAFRFVLPKAVIRLRQALREVIGKAYATATL